VTYNNYNETIVWSENMDDIQLTISDNIGDLISVSADDDIITEDKYSISDDKTLITLKKEFLLTLEDGAHTFVVETDDAIDRYSFTVQSETTPSESDISTADESTKTDTGIPQTGDSSPWKIWIHLSAFAGLTLIIALKKRNKMSR
ncbi:MAG: LPXTG cell wall anchor domain-containing protein, partial [Clostridia bacterium]|nr:LPXTG cell wall anchor domain-containing protein [Clostridia bacterium]